MVPGGSASALPDKFNATKYLTKSKEKRGREREGGEGKGMEERRGKRGEERVVQKRYFCFSVLKQGDKAINRVTPPGL